MSNIFTLKNEATDEIYALIDKHLAKLPKNAEGKIDVKHAILNDTKWDALRHAYVSGVYTMEYSETVADTLGRLNELDPISSMSTKGSENMDLWNNEVGRRLGKKAKDRKELFKLLQNALKKNELILTPSDPRKYKGEKLITKKPKSLVIVIEQSKSGENTLFLDVISQQVLTKSDFLSKIKTGEYPKYEIRVIAGKETPVSKKDRIDNLG